MKDSAYVVQGLDRGRPDKDKVPRASAQLAVNSASQQSESTKNLRVAFLFARAKVAMEHGSPYFGINLPSKQGNSGPQVVQTAKEQGFDFITAKITSRAYRKRVEASLINNTSNGASNAGSLQEVPAPSYDELILQPGSDVASVVALASPWVELDSRDNNRATVSQQVLKHELAYCSFCGISLVVVPGPKRRTAVAKYAHSIMILVHEFAPMKILIHGTFTEEFRFDQSPTDIFSTWEVWNTIRTICASPPTLSLALEVPKNYLPDEIIRRWFCEPVSMLVLSATGTFLANPKGYPVLPKHTQHLVRKFSVASPLFLIKGDFDAGHNQTGTVSEASAEYLTDEQSYLIYMRHLLTENHQTGTLTDLTRNYRDRLQAPLQPLADNLDNCTYEVFESDEAKYILYERAIESSLKELAVTTELLNVAVVGAGRGPLVDRVLSAAAPLGVHVHIIAVEKNPSAVAYLKMRQLNAWGDKVEVQNCDMRYWHPQVSLHLVVSELLGSFGDNELSPECLRNVQKWLVPKGRMIPESYTSFLAPICSPLLHARAKAMLTLAAAGPCAHFNCEYPQLQVPYVVNATQVDVLTDPQLVWSFKHPDNDCRSTKECKLTYTVKTQATIHGFLGYFEAVLYPGIALSTNPVTKPRMSPDVLSWFPIYFPVVSPVFLRCHDQIDLCIWRQADARRLWYEWTVETFSKEEQKRARSSCSILHNFKGTCFSAKI